MGLLGGGPQEVLGLQIDGQQVLIAHLRREGTRLVLGGVVRGTLPQRLDLEQEEEAVPEQLQAPEDVLGLTEETSAEGETLDLLEDQAEETEPETNSEALYSLLNRFPLQRCSLSISLLETSVFFTDSKVPNDTKRGKPLKGKRLKKYLMATAEKERTFEGSLPLRERLRFFVTGKEQLLSIVHEDALDVLRLVDELKPFIGRVQIRLIEPFEVTLMNLVKLAYPPEQQVTAIVYVGEDFSRVVFIKDGEYLAFSQPLHEGWRSDQVLHTLYSRILFQQDVADLPEIGRVVLAGGCRSIDAQSSFSEQFPDAQVDYLALPELNLGQVDEETRGLVSDFAVPIGLAWKTFFPKESRFYPCNFVPRDRIRLQNPLELAWHGLVLFTLLLSSLLFLGIQARNQDRDIDALNLSIRLLNEQIRENHPFIKLVDELHVKIRDYERNFALIDTLAGQKVTWNPMLRDAVEGVHSVGGLWLVRFSTTEGDFDIEAEWGPQSIPPVPERIYLAGKAAYRSRIPKIAERLGDGHIETVVRAKIREKDVHDFDLRVPLVSPE